MLELSQSFKNFLLLSFPSPPHFSSRSQSPSLLTIFPNILSKHEQMLRDCFPVVLQILRLLETSRFLNQFSHGVSLTRNSVSKIFPQVCFYLFAFSISHRAHESFSKCAALKLVFKTTPFFRGWLESFSLQFLLRLVTKKLPLCEKRSKKAPDANSLFSSIFTSSLPFILIDRVF